MERLTWMGCAALLLQAIVVSACGGGSGGNGASEGPRYELSVSISGGGRVSSQPQGIDCGTTCRAAFDAATSVTLTATPASGQRFAGWGGACAGSASTCTLTMDADRTASAQFQALPPVAGWGELVRIAGAGATDPVVAIDAAGRAIAVWRRRDSGSPDHRLWGSRSVAGDSWSAPERLETNVGNVSEIRLSVDRASGRGMLVWIQQGATVDLHARAFDPVTGWAPAALVESGTGMVGVSSVGVDASGNAVAVWSQIARAGSGFSVFANRYTRAAGWGTAGLIETSDVIGGGDGDPIVAVMPGGDALTVWKRSTGSSAELWTNRYAAASAAWGTASQVVADAGTSQFIGRHDLAADGVGGAMLVWGQIDVAAGVANHAIWFKRFGTSGWQADATRVAPPRTDTQGLISTPVLKVNEAGAALVSWVEFDRSLTASLAPAGAPFGSTSTLRPTGPASWSAFPALGLDATGRALVAWSDPDSRDLVVAQRLPGSPWTTAVAIEWYADPAFGPALAMNESGNAVLAWPQFFSNVGTELVVRRYASGP